MILACPTSNANQQINNDVAIDQFLLFNYYMLGRLEDDFGEDAQVIPVPGLGLILSAIPTLHRCEGNTGYTPTQLDEHYKKHPCCISFSSIIDGC